jgi:hypothetical protein
MQSMSEHGADPSDQAEPEPEKSFADVLSRSIRNLVLQRPQVLETGGFVTAERLAEVSDDDENGDNDGDNDDSDEEIEHENGSQISSGPRGESRAPLNCIQVFAKKVFALQSLRELLKRLDPHQKRIKYRTYAKEYIVWCFYRDGADCGRSDDATRCAVIKYVTAILLDGKVEVNGNTQKMTQQQAQEVELIGKAHKLEDFLSEYFMIERKR